MWFAIIEDDSIMHAEKKKQCVKWSLSHDDVDGSDNVEMHAHKIENKNVHKATCIKISNN